MQFRSTFFVAALLACAAASSAMAATVTYTLDLTGAPGTFDLFAQSSPGDNFGIASYNVLLNGPILSVDHASPNSSFANGPGGPGPAGFTLFRSADGLSVIGASQDTVAPTPNLIRGFGQEASSFAAKGMTPFLALTDPGTWDAKLLIARGTYADGTVQPSFVEGSIEVFTNVFSQEQGNAVRSAEVDFVVLADLPNTPPVGVDAAIGDIMAGPGMIVTHQFQATDAEDPGTALVWSDLQFSGQPGNMGSGVHHFSPTLGADGAFSWNTNGSARGVYTATATVTDTGGLSDTAILTLDVTKVPEPATLALSGLAMVGLVGLIRRRS